MTRHGSLANSAHGCSRILAMLPVITLLAGCAQPFRIQPSLPQNPDRNVAWWVAEDAENLLPPIVAIEHRLAQNQTLQTVFTDRGVRSFRFEGRKLESAGPPLPENTRTVDVRFLRSAFRRYQNWPNRAPVAIPTDRTTSVTQVADIAAILSEHWPDHRVPSPDIPFRDLNIELEHHPHGVKELLALNEVF